MSLCNLYEVAQTLIPGGVNSPVRAFGGVGGTPFFVKRGEGAYLFDVNDKPYIDYVCSWGPLILGHAHPYVLNKLTAAIANGLTFGAPTEIEINLAQKIQNSLPSMELIRFVNSGTEAAMSAIRLARGFTQKNKILKFAGCYHGHADGLLVQSGSGGLTFGVPSSQGVPPSLAALTLVAEYNNLAEVRAIFAEHGDDIAAVIVEPVAGNMNLVLPLPEFLPGLRKLCDEYQSLLIFDEVISGFRIALGGAQSHYGVTPDLTILGKIIGGGLPVGAYGGRKAIMQLISPLGPVYQAGTLSGNPLAMTAGLAQLELISQPGFYQQLSEQTASLVNAIKNSAHAAGIALQVRHVGAMFGLFFCEQETIHHEADVKAVNLSLFKQFFHAMLAEGVYFAPSAFEIGFLSSAHDELVIEKTLNAVKKVFAKLSASQV